MRRTSLPWKTRRIGLRSVPCFFSLQNERKTRFMWYTQRVSVVGGRGLNSLGTEMVG